MMLVPERKPRRPFFLRSIYGAMIGLFLVILILIATTGQFGIFVKVFAPIWIVVMILFFPLSKWLSNRVGRGRFIGE